MFHYKINEALTNQQKKNLMDGEVLIYFWSKHNNWAFPPKFNFLLAQEFLHLTLPQSRPTFT